MALTRRTLIHSVGRAGGVAVAYRTMAAMGLLAAPAGYAGPPVLAGALGAGRHVAILGAGIAGMVAAFELGKAGYRCTIPLSVLRHIPADFSAPVRVAIAAADYIPAAKLAFQAERRFWELDDHIFGGISWTTRDITQIWYPSAGVQQRNGILVGAYIWSDREGDAFAGKPPAQRESYPALLAGDGPFLFAGEHMSYLTGWQEGAVLSAHAAVAAAATR